MRGWGSPHPRNFHKKELFDMSTPILKVISQYCSAYVDDVRLQELAETNPPLYARRMYNYFRPAIALFNQPADMQEYFFGTAENPNFIDPVMDNTSYLMEEAETADFIVPLGASYAGFDLCACQVKTYDALGNVILTPIDITYDSTTGNVTVHATLQNSVSEQSVLEFDLYTDGEFIKTLSPEVMNILGMCFKVIWQNRFNTNWLSMVPKVEDRSFFEQNRANKMNADSNKLQNDVRWLNEEMQKFENNLYIRQIVPPSLRVKI
jgi:hypothetical protein